MKQKFSQADSGSHDKYAKLVKEKNMMARSSRDICIGEDIRFHYEE